MPITSTNDPIASLERQGDVGESGEGQSAASAVPQAQARSGVPFDSEKGREAALRSVESRRAKKAEREATANLDRLGVSGRVSTALAKVMTYADLVEVIGSLKGKAMKGEVMAARELRSWLALAGIDGGADDGEAKSFEDMSPAQRAAARAQLMSDIEQLESPA